MDIAAFIFGLPGLVTACADIYELTVNARRLGDEGVLLVTKIVIEQAKFQVWLEDVGWLSESGPTISLKPVLQKVLKDTLEGIHLTLGRLGDLIDKYELDEGGKVTSLHFALPDKFWKLNLSGKEESAAKRSKAIRKKNRIAQLSWAKGDMQIARDLIDDLRRFNEDLRSISGDMGRATFSSLPSTVLPRVFDPTNLDRLVKASAEEEPDLARCAAIKLEVLQVTATWDATAPVPNSPLRKGRNVIKEPPGTSPPTRAGRRVAVYVEKSGVEERVLLEDKVYSDMQAEEFTEKRVQEIAQILVTAPKPERLRVLDCVGYHPQRQRQSFAFVYRFPPDANTAMAPITLHDLMSEGAEHSIPKPALGARFELARALATSLLLLQACGVLHKALSDTNVLFFKFSGSDEYDLSRPYLAGFDFARLLGDKYVSDKKLLEQSEEDSDRLYAHPSYLASDKQRYLPIFDIYSLGLLLAQVALWADIPAVLGHLSDPAAARQPPPPPTRRRLLECLVRGARRLEPEVGEVMARAVARCVSGDLNNERLPMDQVPVLGADGLADLTQHAFEKNVVKELEKCRA